MMLEARVRTVEARECTECMDCRSDRLDAKSAAEPSFERSISSCHCSCSNSFLLFFMQNLQTRYVTIPIAARPPMTPPAMAPVLGLLLVALVELADDVTWSAAQYALGHDEQLDG
jgi:hypothetical protein